jgi:pilus assembly protein Flp/PilA
MKKQIMKFLRDEDGLTMVEYAVAGGLITLGAVLAFGALGTAVSGKIQAIATTVENAGG